MKLKDLLAILSHVDDDEVIETKEDNIEVTKKEDIGENIGEKILDEKDQLIALLKEQIVNKDNLINEHINTIKGLKEQCLEDPKETEYTLNELIERNEF